VRDAAELKRASVPRESCIALRSAAQKIQAQADFRLTRLYVANVQAPNAFATRDKSGHPVAAVTLGMLTAIGPDEAAWAGLLGHEIAHHVKKHDEGRKSAATSASVTGNVVANVFSYAIPGVGGLIGGTLAGAAAQNAMYGAYTRPQEAEADEVGLKWTHPANEERSRRVEAFIASSDNSPPKPSP